MYKPNHYGSNTWDCFSYKLNRSVVFYSDLEYELWIILETDPEVLAFCEQPLKISGIIDNKIHHSILDMWVKYKDGTEKFIEVKYMKDKLKINDHNSRISRQLRLQEKWSKEEKINYEILTENEIRTQPLLSNLKIMVPYFKNFNGISELLKHQLLNIIRNGAVTLKELNKLELMDKTLLNSTLFYLYHQGVVEIDIDINPFNYSSKVWCKNG